MRGMGYDSKELLWEIYYISLTLINLITIKIQRSNTENHG